MPAFNLAFMEQFANLPICRSYMDVDMLGRLYPCMLYYRNGMLQYFGIILMLYIAQRFILFHRLLSLVVCDGAHINFAIDGIFLVCANLQKTTEIMADLLEHPVPND